MKDDGGPAFPLMDVSQNTATGETVSHQYCYTGMALRDFFAAKAMQALVSQPFDHLTDRELAQIPYTSYEMADAMLKARGGKS